MGNDWMNCTWPEESWVHVILSFNICKIVKLWFKENNGNYAKNLSEIDLGKFIVKSIAMHCASSSEGKILQFLLK